MGQTMLKNVLPSIYAKQNASRKNIHHISKSNKKGGKIFLHQPSARKAICKTCQTCFAVEASSSPSLSFSKQERLKWISNFRWLRRLEGNLFRLSRDVIISP